MFIDISPYSGEAIFHLSQVLHIFLFSPLTPICKFRISYELTTYCF